MRYASMSKPMVSRNEDGLLQTVAYFDNTYSFGGAINALAHLLSALDRSRYRALVFSSQSAVFLKEAFRGIDARHWPIRLPWVHGKTHRPALSDRLFRGAARRFIRGKVRALGWVLINDLPEAFRIAKTLRRENVNLVHLNNGVEGMAPALLAARALRLPIVAHARGPQSTTGLSRLYAALPTSWIAVSESISSNLVAAGVRRDRIKVVHDAIDLSSFAPGPADDHLREQLGIPQDALVFGIFGRIIPWKGIREFVQAAQVVLNRTPTARALIVGDRSDGAEAYYDEVVALTAELGIRDRVLFTGFRRDVPELMRLCNVVVHASIIPEPFGMTVIEAMATGTPVVAANSGGPTEIIVSGETGILVDPADVAALSSAIAGLLDNRELALQIGRRAAERTQKAYSNSRYASDVEAVYNRVAPKRVDLRNASS